MTYWKCDDEDFEKFYVFTVTSVHLNGCVDYYTIGRAGRTAGAFQASDLEPAGMEWNYYVAPITLGNTTIQPPTPVAKAPGSAPPEGGVPVVPLRRVAAVTAGATGRAGRHGSNRRRADRVAGCCRRRAVAFQVGDRVRVKADAPAGSVFLSRGYALISRRGLTFTVMPRDHYAPSKCFADGTWRDTRDCTPLDDGTGSAFFVHPDDLEMTQPAKPTVLARFAELAKDPAMLPVLEAAADYYEAMCRVCDFAAAHKRLDEAANDFVNKC